MQARASGFWLGIGFRVRQGLGIGFCAPVSGLNIRILDNFYAFLAV